MSYYGHPLGGANWPYTAYLIERGSPAEFWVGGSLSEDAGNWTADAEKALKCHTESEAQGAADRMMKAGRYGTVRVCAHIFSCGTTTERSADMNRGETNG